MKANFVKTLFLFLVWSFFNSSAHGQNPEDLQINKEEESAPSASTKPVVPPFEKSESTESIIELLVDTPKNLGSAQKPLTKETLRQIKTQEARIEIEWDPVEGAQNYELHVFTSDKKLLKKTFSPSHVFEVQLRPGRYLLRARVSDQRQVWGAWSDWTEFKVLATLPIPFLTTKSLFGTCRDWRALGGEVNATFSYKNYLGTQWKPVFQGAAKELRKMLIEKLPPPGFYRFEIRASNPGWKDSPVLKQECQRKPTLQEVEA